MAELHIDGKPVPFPRISPNANTRPRDIRPSMIVLHSTGGSFAGAVAWLCNPQAKVSAHFVVARDGELRQLVRLADVAWHAGKSVYQGRAVLGSVNAISIGVEMEHLDGRQDWPDRQVAAVAKLCAAICRACNIDPAHVTGHRQVCVPRGRKVDPQDFPWVTFRRMLAQELADDEGGM